MRAEPETAKVQAPRLYTVRDLSQILCLGEATIRTLIYSGELAAIKIGVEWRVQDKDLDAFLEAKRSSERSEVRDGRRKGKKPGAPAKKGQLEG